MISNRTIAKAYMVFATIILGALILWEIATHQWSFIVINIISWIVTYFIMRSDL